MIPETFSVSISAYPLQKVIYLTDNHILIPLIRMHLIFARLRL